MTTSIVKFEIATLPEFTEYNMNCSDVMASWPLTAAATIQSSCFDGSAFQQGRKPVLDPTHVCSVTPMEHQIHAGGPISPDNTWRFSEKGELPNWSLFHHFPCK